MQEVRWYHFTPDKLLLGLVVVEVFLLLSDSFSWFSFNEKKGWTPLIAMAILCLALLTLLAWHLIALCLGRRFQMSIRSFGAASIAAAIGAGMLGNAMWQSRLQSQAVEVVRASGGRVTYDYEIEHIRDLMYADEMRFASAAPWVRKYFGDDYGSEISMIRAGKSFGNDDMRMLRNVRHLKDLDLNRTLVDDTGLRWLAQVTELESLGMPDACGDQGISYLRHVPRLRSLELSYTQVTDSGLQYLEHLTELERLYLGCTRVSDEGLKHLRGLNSLVFLALEETQVSDDGMEYLEQLPNLLELRLIETQVTEKGVEEFHKTQGNCSVYLRDSF